MTEDELEEFQRQRDQFRTLTWFQHTAPATHMTQEQLRAARQKSRDSLHRGLYVGLPSRLVLFNDRHIQLDLHDDAIKPHLSRLSEAFPYFPELRSLTISNYEGQPTLMPLLRATYKAAHLSSIKFLDGKLTSEQVAVLAEHPTLKALYLTRCHISLTDFALLARMKSLEEVWLANGSAATPECFLTLVKLPKLRSVYLDAQDAFDVPISDDVQQAIKSLDGRLEEVVAQFPATVHPSLVSALLKVKSLRTLDIATVSEGLRFADVERLGDLTRLTRFNMTLAPDDNIVDLAERKKIDAVLIRTSRRAQERWKQIHQNGA